MINIQRVTIQRGTKILLQEASLSVYFKQHIGIIGENGCGKTTFFSILLQELHPDKGLVELPKNIKFGYVEQETSATSQIALEFVIDGDVELRKIQTELVEAEKTNNGILIAKLHAEMDEINAYSAESRACQIMDGLGFTIDDQQKMLKDFSGGWRVRLNLAKALMRRADVLLLDEPTNHLDLDAVVWLEQWLKKFKGTLLIISHDREFLDNVVQYIVHFSQKQLKIYSGNYSSFEKQLAEKILLQQAAYEKQQKKLQHLNSFINRFRAKASKAKQAQSRMKAIEKMDIISAVQIDTPFEFSFREFQKCPNPLVTLHNVSLGYHDKLILDNINLTLTPNDRIGLIGPNGAGKSTLIKCLAQQLKISNGDFISGEGIKIGYFAQHQIDNLDLQISSLDQFKKLNPSVKESEIRNFLGGFGFIGDRVFEKIENFSGGEKSRLALALIVWQRPNLLLLDEPTNHLDLEMRQALSLALQEYQGALVLVSHDRFLVKTTVDQLILVADGQVSYFNESLDEYEKWLLNYRRAQVPTKIKEDKTLSSKKEQRQLDAKIRELRRPLLLKIKKLEKEIEETQTELTDIETLLRDDNLYIESEKDQLQKILMKQSQLLTKLKKIESAWLIAYENLEKIN